MMMIMIKSKIERRLMLNERNLKGRIKVKVPIIQVGISVRTQIMFLVFQSIQGKIKSLEIKRVTDLLKTLKHLENQIL